MAEVIDTNEDVIPAPTTDKSRAIKAIAKDTVHKICSGQVVLSLAIAVKELVENSIDAGATLIEVKLKDQGLESLEVCDNGSGVEEGNLEGMTAKYHTSKIREFVDLQGVETFGFRGEALSSLCALSDMSIVTRHRSTDVGIKVELDHEGKIKKRSPCARSVGTTVTLSNLFSTLPVRKRDFTRNIKKEFAKMCQILQAYGLAAKGVRIICTNHTAKGGKSVLMQTHGAQDVLSNISAIFGARQMADIIPFKAPFEGQVTEESLLSDINDEDASFQITREDVERLNEGQFHLEGYISSCTHGAGRSSRDRQYFFINSRPCDPKNVAKLVNEIYRRYNINQFPFIYLNVVTERSQVDVNLTPDKRQLLINNEKILLLVIKKALLNTFGNIPSTYKMQNTTINSMLKSETNPTTNRNVAEDNEMEGEGPEVPKSSSKRFMDVLSQWKHTGDTVGVAPAVPAAKRKCSDEISTRTLKLKKIQEYLTKEQTTNLSESCSYKSESDSDDEKDNEKEIDKKPAKVLNQSVLDMKQLQQESREYDILTSKESSTTPATIVERIDCKVLTPARPPRSIITLKSISQTIPPLQLSQNSAPSDDDDTGEILFNSQPTISKTILLDDCASDEESTNYSCSEIRTSIAEIDFSLKAEETVVKQNRDRVKLDRLRFKSEISPSQNSNAEQELQKEISKEMFAAMEIIGQFNLGFIIVKLDTDLFIVDQHATDEKYNFEMLQRTVVLQHQPLAVPQLLDMTAVNEMILLDHLDVFEKNGFKFEINPNDPPTRKVRLLGKPFSKNWEFGRDDIDELIFMLQDAPDGTLCRPSRIRAMFASRACRKSVMIGKALNRATMKTLITHMGEIEQPWNCPHGRPTMRHLINIAMLQEENEEKQQP